MVWATMPLASLGKDFNVGQEVILADGGVIDGNRTRTCGLAALRLLGQLRNGRLAALSLATLPCSARLRLAASRTAGTRLRRPIDVNDREH